MPKQKKEENNLYPKDLQFGLSNYEKAKKSGGMTKFFQDIKKWQDQYMSRTKAQGSNFYSNYPNMQTTADIFAPETFKAIQTIKSTLMAETYQQDSLEIEEHPDSPPEARDAYLLYLEEQRKESRHDIEMEKIYLTILKFGAGIAKKYWKVDNIRKKVPVLMRKIDEKSGKVKTDPVTGEPLIAGVEHQEVLIQKGYPYLKNLDLKKVFLIGDTNNFYEIDGVIEQIDNVDWESLWALRKRKQKLKSGKVVDVGIYFNLEYAKKNNTLPTGKNTNEQQMDSREYQEARINPLQQPSEKDQRTATTKHSLLEVWAWRDLDGKGKKVKSVITILDEKVVIRREPIPFNHNLFPYLMTPCMTQEDSMYGIGMCQLVEGLQWELNAKRNQMLDSVTFALNNMWLRTDTSIQDHQVKSRPGAIIDSTRPDGLTPLKKGLTDVNAGIVSAAKLQEDIRDSTGATSPIQGQKVRGKSTLGERESMVSAGSRRIVDIMKNIERHLLYPDIQMSHSLNQQFIEKKVIVQIPSRKVMIEGKLEEVKGMAYVIKQEDIRFDFKFKFNVATQMENRLIKNQALMNYVITLGKSGLPPQIIGPATYRLLKQAWLNLQLGGADVVFPQELESKIYAMFGQVAPQGSQPNPENAEKTLRGGMDGPINGQQGQT